MATYTHDDFDKAYRQSGYRFSDADLALAWNNPDAGMSILKYKNDWQNAKTEQERLLANQGAERIRSGYGGYTGGADGSSFALDPISPNDYKNPYAEREKELTDAILNREKFTYNADTDPLFQEYRKQMAREGKRATEDTMGSYAGMTGGMPSTAAVSAAQQAGDYYASKMGDKAQELYTLAYNQYLQELSGKRDDLSMLQGKDQTEYARWLDEVNSQENRRSDDYQRRYNLAQLGASVGDYSGLRELGITPQIQSTDTAATGYAGRSSAAIEKLLSGQVNEIKAKYGEQEIDADSWNALLARGYTPEALYNAGFYPGGKKGLTDSEIAELKSAYPGGAIPADEYDALTGVGISRDWLQAAGFTRGSSSLLSEQEWNQRKSQYLQSGVGIAAVTNYDTYDAYKKAFNAYQSGTAASSGSIIKFGGGPSKLENRRYDALQ